MGKSLPREARRGGFIEHADRFDADYFGIGPAEAAAMDPRQGMMLELTRQALEDAHIPPASVRGTAAGGFVGAMGDDHATLRAQHESQPITAHTLTGTSRAVIANRVSHTLGVPGPSLTVDTAQSSSLVAIHLACQALRAGECELAMAGGVSLMLDPAGALAVDRLGVLSPDGRCRVFDAHADGTVRGEGAAVVVLKPLLDALADGNRVYCLIRGGAVNHDGTSEGLTTPSAEAQQRLIAQACRHSGTDPARVQYVELHGTGTPTGDPVEAHALAAALTTGRDRPLPVGSVKANIGHPEAAAGAAGLLKTALALYHRHLPPTLHHHTPHPRIPLHELRLHMQTALTPWPDHHQPLTAGVSSFGMGGTNCHLILEQAPLATDQDDVSAPVLDTPLAVVPVSAATRPALQHWADRLHRHLTTHPDSSVPDVGHALSTGRAHLRHRAAIITGDRQELLDGLSALADGKPSAHLVHGAAAAPLGKTVFVFPGQGWQHPGMANELYCTSPVFRHHIQACADALDPHVDWSGQGWQHPGMANELYCTSPVFRHHIQACADALDPHVDWSLTDVFTHPEDTAWLGRVDMVHPVLWAVMISLARLWESLGISPDAVVGHSQGEVAAAHIAGALSLRDSAQVIALRAKALVALSGQGAMAVLGLPVQQAGDLLNRWDGQLTVAGVNSPGTVVVSGAPGVVDQLLDHCQATGTRARRLPTDYAAHSAQIDTITDEVHHSFTGVTPRPAARPLYSTVEGRVGSTPLDTTVMGPGYWVENLRRPVQFHHATHT